MHNRGSQGSHRFSAPVAAPAPTLPPRLQPRPALQYAAMFVAAGQPGDVKKVQASVATARKVFRIMRVRVLVNRAPYVLQPVMCRVRLQQSL